MINKEQIAKAKEELNLENANYQHDDCIRIAYEWLDAQKKIKKPRNVPSTSKHLIERWAGRYVSESDVRVAAHLHPLISGNYPFYNISSRLTEPSIERLKEISEAFTQGQRSTHQVKDYSIQE